MSRRLTMTRAVVLLLIAAMAIMALSVQAGAMQYVNLPKYDVELTPDPQVADGGSQVQVTAHVVLLYFQKGTDPSVPGIYVECELKGPTGAIISSVSGITDSSGYFKAGFTAPSDPGEYTLVARAYDVAGGAVNGQNEARLGVRPAAAATIAPATATPVVSTPLPPTAVPTAVPTESKPKVGGLLGSSELLLIGGAIILLGIIFLAVVAVVAFFLLRRKKKPVKPAEPVASMPAPAQQPAPPQPQAQQPAAKRFCMHCGAPMSMDASFCTSCGQAPPSGVDTKECPACHTVVPESAKFCNNCGSVQPESPKK